MKKCNSRQVVIAQSNILPSRWENILGDSALWSWIYFGRNSQRFSAINKMLLGRAQMFNSGEMINRIAEEIRMDFINFDQHLDLNRSELLWQTTDIAEKNPYTSDLFYNCCAYLAFDQILQTLETNLLVFLEDWFLGWQMAKHARGVGFRSHHITGHSILDVCPGHVSYGLYRIRQVLQALSCRVDLVRAFYRKAKTIANYPRTNAIQGTKASKNIDILLVTWADPNTFQADQTIQANTYYGELPRFLRTQGIEIGYIANPVSWVYPFEEIVKNIKCAQDRVILPEECLGLKDVLYITWKTLFYSVSLKSRFVIQGTDVTELVKNELRKERIKSRQCWATQFYYVGRFLLENGIRPAVVVHPYENQPWEKSLRLGLRQYLPETKIVGYQHAPFSLLWLGYFPSRRDLQKLHFPDYVVTIGQRWKTLLLHHGYPSDRLKVGAALRFGHILGQHNARCLGKASDTMGIRGTRTLLVAGSIGYADSFELVYKTIEALHNTPDIRALLKFHPKMGGSRTQLVAAVLNTLGAGNLPDHFEITEQSVSELLPSVDLLLYNITSVSYEAIAWSVPAIFIQSDIWFDMDPLPLNSGIAVAARTPAEILKAVKQLLSEDEEAVQKRWEKIQAMLPESFCPIRQDTMRCFLDFDGVSTQLPLRNLVAAGKQA
jgi:hypothetical protein